MERDERAERFLAAILSNPGGPLQANDLNGWNLVNCGVGDVVAFAYEFADAFPLAKPDPDDDEGDWVYVHKTGVNISGCLDRDTAKRVIEEQARVIEELRGKPSTPSLASQQNDTPGADPRRLTDEELWDAYGLEYSYGAKAAVLSCIRPVADAQLAKADAQRERDRVRVSMSWLRSWYNDNNHHPRNFNEWVDMLRSIGIVVEDSK